MWCGIDSSTQSLKVMLVDSSHLIHHEVSVNFDAELGQQYGVQGGITRRTYGLPKDIEHEPVERVSTARARTTACALALSFHLVRLLSAVCGCPALRCIHVRAGSRPL